ncbi:MAG: hypothetical protein RL693_2310 [Verrucomicrobiota bacterium]|jgi:acyl transferase domain-containing protein
MTVKKNVVWMFSGQGSQYDHMGKELYDHEPVFRACLDRCDSIVRPWIQVSLIDCLYGERTSSIMDDTRLTHLAICAVQYAMARTLQARGHHPDVLLGYSLGEMVAHLVAETIPLELGLELLYRHASLMESATPAGGMIAILETPNALLPALRDIPDLWISAHNFENHFVASGTTRALEALQHLLEIRQTTMHRLPVRRAFHSPLMDPAESLFQGYLLNICPDKPRFDVISATTGALSTGVDGFWSATRDPINFLQTIRRLESDHPQGLLYADLGPSGTLATFLKYIGLKPESQCFSIMTPWGGAQKKMQTYESTLAAS